MHSRRLVQSLFLWYCLQSFLQVDVRAGDLVQVTLADGRIVKGEPHAATDQNWLGLLRREASFELLSSFEWSQVTGGEIGGRQVTRQELQTWALQHKVKGRPIQQFIPDQVPLAEPAPAISYRKVRTLVIQTQLAQWDQDVATDGIRVHIAPLDEQGELVPVAGQIMLTLFGERKHLQGGESYLGPPTFVELARRSFVVRAEDFARGPAMYELPFSPRHPESDPNLVAVGLLHARFGVTGQGVFEASDSRVPLKQCSLFRDQLQYSTPGRLLPIEAGLGNR